MMSKKEYEIYDRALKTGQMFEQRYFKLVEALKKLCDYIELRKDQLQYAESKEESEFYYDYIRNAIKSLDR